ncbi:UNVERIFIED_CONTAM: hypothetical protein FKN15_042278 [Acipenser sinensis]
MYLNVDGDSQSLKEHLIDELDYILIPTEGWTKLVSWYGLTENQEPVARKYKLVVPKVGYISDLCAALSTLSGVPADRMIVTDIYNHRFHRIFATDENLSSIMERDDIYVFEMAINRSEDTDHVIIPVYQREKYRQSGYNHSGSPLFGQPFLITVPRVISEDKFYNMLLLRMCRYVQTTTENDEAEETPRCCKDRGVNGDGSNGVHEEGSPSEMETDEQDDESSQDQELPSENDNSQSEGSVGGDNDLENGIGADQKSKGQQQLVGHKKRLFTFQFNNLGNTDFNYIKEETRQIRFDDRQHRLDGEMETDEQDDESSQDQELPSENDNSQSEGSVGGDNDLENGIGADQKNKGQQQLVGHKKRLFTFQFNNLGNTDFNYIKEETRQIRFDDRQHRLDERSYLSLDWEPGLKKIYFDDNAAEATLDLWSLPPVLVVHVKRFSYSRYMRDKLDTLVDFPISDLDMSEFLINPNAGPCRYDLIAVSNHYGGMGGGHYTAFAKSKDDDKWYYFDDSSDFEKHESMEYKPQKKVFVKLKDCIELFTTKEKLGIEDPWYCPNCKQHQQATKKLDLWSLPPVLVSKAAYVLFYQRQDTISGTGYFALDREAEKGASAAAGAPAESDEDLNENDNDEHDAENENCMHTN